jgi:ClpX C4-type zinc finger
LISLEILVNGQRRAVAGATDAELLNATVSLYPNVKDGWLDISGSILAEGQPPADASWLTAALAIGDTVEVRLINSEDVQAPKLSRVDPTRRSTDGVPTVCAFCDKPPLEAEGMMSSRKAMICRGCVEYLHEMLHTPADEG